MSEYYKPGGGLMPHLGAVTDETAPAPGTNWAMTLEKINSSPWYTVWRIAAVTSAAVCVYHGYKRNKSVGWAILWGLLGGTFPIITPAIALAQGFGKPRVSTNRRRRGLRRS